MGPRPSIECECTGLNWLGRRPTARIFIRRFYCNRTIARKCEIDHFLPRSYSGDEGLDNLAAACHRCNNSKPATLAGPDHLAALLCADVTARPRTRA
jgi:hypothetical protein